MGCTCRYTGAGGADFLSLSRINHMTELYIKPVPGLTVRDPDTYEPLAVNGEKENRVPASGCAG
ncbi:DUF2635 domain-containing protein [Erwinia tracheiphila]